MKDPYQALGVDKSASAAEIKKAFRKLAPAREPIAIQRLMLDPAATLCLRCASARERER